MCSSSVARERVRDGVNGNGPPSCVPLVRLGLITKHVPAATA